VRVTPRRILAALFAALLSLSAACGDDSGGTGTIVDDSEDSTGGSDDGQDGQLPEDDEGTGNVTDDTTTADTSPNSPGDAEG
jgi:hypothetical protein